MSSIGVKAALESWVESLAKEFPEQSVFVAFSGGLDSTVLLHGLALLLPNRLRAVHINHGLQVCAEQWSDHCRDQCEILSVPFKLLVVTPDLRAGVGVEAAARSARYTALESCLAPDDVLVTGHHRSDQAETVLLSLMRASGPAGLAAMPESKAFGSGRLHRPLLAVPRSDLEAYGKQYGLRWIEDPSNQDQQLRRNFLRHTAIPDLQELWPEAEKSLARVAELQAEALNLLEELAAQDFAAARVGSFSVIDESTGAGGEHVWLSIPAVQSLSPARQKNLLRFWFERQSIAIPQSQNWPEMNSLFIDRAGANPVWHFPKGQVRRYGDWLSAFSELPTSPSADWAINVRADEACMLPTGLGTYLVSLKSAAAGFAAVAEMTLEIRFRRGGERFRPRPNASRVTLKNALNERRIPPWQRDKTPLLFMQNQLVAFGEQWLAEELAEEFQPAGDGQNCTYKLADLMQLQWIPCEPQGWAKAPPR